MLGYRIKKAKLKAKKRFKIWYPDYDATDPAWKNCPEDALLGTLRKNSTVCSGECCRNPRRCTFTKVKERPTVQERRAPTIESFADDYDDVKVA